MQSSHCRIIGIPLFILATIYFVGLLAVLLLFGFTPTNDGEGYLEYAQVCLAEGQPYPTNNIYHTSPFIWNIGIINLTELSLWLFHSIKPLLILLCMMKALTALFLALTTKRLMGYSAAVICLILFAVYPNTWGQSTMLSSEIPSTMLAVTAVYLFVCHHQLFICGLLLALANWFRPTATIFLLVIISFLIIFQRKQLLKNICLLLAGFTFFIIIVGTSCYLRTGHFIYQARSYWFSMVDECYDGAEVAPHWGQPVWLKGTPRYIDNYEQMDCFEYERIWKERSISWLKDHPGDYLSKIPDRLYYMYQSDYDNMPAFLSDKSKAENNYITIPYRHLISEYNTINFAQCLSLASLLFYYILLIIATIGAFNLYHYQQYRTLFLTLFIIVGGTLALVIVMHGETRFKDPLMPFIFMLASIGIYRMKICKK